MYIYEKPIAELIDFSLENIMEEGGNAGGAFGSIEEGDEPL